MRLNFTIALDLDADTMETALSWSVRHKLSATASIPDPNQPSLPYGDGATSVTIESGGSSVTIDANAARLLRQAAKEMTH